MDDQTVQQVQLGTHLELRVQANFVGLFRILLLFDVVFESLKSQDQVVGEFGYAVLLDGLFLSGLVDHLRTLAVLSILAQLTGQILDVLVFKRQPHHVTDILSYLLLVLGLALSAMPVTDHQIHEFLLARPGGRAVRALYLSGHLPLEHILDRPRQRLKYEPAELDGVMLVAVLELRR